MEKSFSIGIVGLGVMGRSLAQNFLNHGYTPIGYDLNTKMPDGFEVKVTDNIEELVASLNIPRVILMMVPAGIPVESVINSLEPHLQKGDLIIDGGNSHFSDTERHVRELEKEGLHFIGMGVSGGEKGALMGPSLMPGGSAAGWPLVRDMLEAISAKADNGEPCVAWMGEGGAGHFVKMVHNGIEYGDMQLIAEIYDLLHRGAGISNPDLGKIFTQWNDHELRSYLIEITAKILARIDPETGSDLVDVILDEAAQKGTGIWTSQTALDTGAAIPTINAAVEARLLSALKLERIAAAKVLGKGIKFADEKSALVTAAGQALYASKIMSYAQGLTLLKMASKEYGWTIDISRIIPVWRAGCIIRADLLRDITNAYRRDPALPNLLMDEFFTEAVLKREKAFREVVQTGVRIGIPMLAAGASLAYFDSYRSRVLPANLIQAQRDYFGAHTYRRLDREGFFHTQWEE